jgi:hypothetical protein
MNDINNAPDLIDVAPQVAVVGALCLGVLVVMKLLKLL